jgi:hypothetical protein
MLLQGKGPPLGEILRGGTDGDRSRTMRLIERDEVPQEHFTEGEPDLEAPEELALGELEEEQLLEEELDNEDISEEDVDEATLELTLEDLVHRGDPLGTTELEERPDPDQEPGEGELDALEIVDLDVAELEDIEESLDHILSERLASDLPEEDYVDFEDYEEETPEGTRDNDRNEPGPSALAGPRFAAATARVVASCGAEEFVCSSCHLVRNKTQLSNPAMRICGDCSV